MCSYPKKYSGFLIPADETWSMYSVSATISSCYWILSGAARLHHVHRSAEIRELAVRVNAILYQYLLLVFC